MTNQTFSAKTPAKNWPTFFCTKQADTTQQTKRQTTTKTTSRQRRTNERGQKNEAKNETKTKKLNTKIICRQQLSCRRTTIMHVQKDRRVDAADGTNPDRQTKVTKTRQETHQTRPDQTRPDQTRPDQTRPDQTRLFNHRHKTSPNKNKTQNTRQTIRRHKGEKEQQEKLPFSYPTYLVAICVLLLRLKSPVCCRPTDFYTVCVCVTAGRCY